MVIVLNTLHGLTNLIHITNLSIIFTVPILQMRKGDLERLRNMPKVSTAGNWQMQKNESGNLISESSFTPSPCLGKWLRNHFSKSPRVA